MYLGCNRNISSLQWKCIKESTYEYFIFINVLFLEERQVLMNKIRDIASSLIDQNENLLCYTLFFGKGNMNDSEIFLMQQ